MKRLHPHVLMPAVGRRAADLPPRLNPGNATFLDDICDVLVDPAPDPEAAEIVHRWLRDEVANSLSARLGQGDRDLVTWACEAEPSLIWKLPHSQTVPPERFHRLIVSALLPRKLLLVKQELARIAFSWQMRGLWYVDEPPSP